MKNLENFINKIKKNNNVVYLDDLLELNLDSEEFEELLKILNNNKIRILDFNKEEKNDEKEYSTDIELQYLKDIRGARFLSKEEERELIKRSQDGDKEALNELICNNQGLIRSVATSYSKTGKIEFLDAIQEGNIGLLIAIDKFDLNTDFKLSTYAMCWIKQCIKRASISKSNAIRLPITQKEVQNRIKSFENIYFIKNGQYPTTLETSISLGIKEEEINLIKKYDTEIISLNAPIGEEDLTFEDCIKDDIDIEEIVENIEMLKKLRKFIQEKLTKREKEVLNLRVYKDYTLSQIGERLKISTENVRRVEIKYKKKIKKYFDENQLL